jgi:hypothetical protein
LLRTQNNQLGTARHCWVYAVCLTVYKRGAVEVVRRLAG